MTEAAPPSRPRVLSGMRPTGRLHLGNYMGALHNWVGLQAKYDCFFFIADLHALTTDYADTSKLVGNIREVALDFLAAGLDPAASTLFVQRRVPAHAELHLLLSMITPVSWLERVPTYKDQQEQLREKDLATYGFLGYPLLQSADILLYQPNFVPVGADQVSHVELTREVARRFNQLYPGAFSLSPDAAPWEIEAIKTPRSQDLGRQGAVELQPAPAARGGATDEEAVAIPPHRGASGAAGSADPQPQAPRNRRPQDVQELRQHHSTGRAGG